MDTTNSTAQAFDKMDEPFLPDGWEPGQDIFSLDEEAPLPADEPGTDAISPTESDTPESGQTEPETDAPTLGVQETEPDADSEGRQAGEETPDNAADEPQKDAAPSPRILKLRVDREDRDFDVTDTTDERLAELLQKGLAFEARAEKDKVAEYRRIYRQAVDSGYEDFMARAAAAHAVGGADYPLTDEPEPAPPTPPAQPTADFSAALAEMRQMRQELDALKASAADKDGQLAALRKENARMKQQAEAAQKAPVRGVTGGGAAQKGKSAFDEAFDSGFDKY